jgi:hypothetical protein
VPQQVEKKVVGKYSCAECKTPGLVASRFLLWIEVDPGAENGFRLKYNPDWVGMLWGVCQPCSSLGIQTFNQQQRKAWNDYRRFVDGTQARARDIRPRGQRAIIEHYGTGVSDTALRKLSLLRLKPFITVLSRSILDSNFMKNAATEITKDYVADGERLAGDPEAIPDPNGKFFDKVEIGYMTELAAGIAVSWVCRFPECLYFGMNSQWIKAANERFKCPRCARDYQPFSCSKGQLENVSRCVSYVDSTGNPVCFLAAWPSSQDDKWINRMIEARFMELQNARDYNEKPSMEVAEAFARRAVEDIDKLAAEGIPVHFNHFQMTPEAIWTMGSCAEHKWPRANWQFLAERGFHGSHFMDHAGADLRVWTDWDTLINHFAHILQADKLLAAASGQDV